MCPACLPGGDSTRIFTEKDVAVLKTIQRKFEDKYTKYTIMLLTRKEDLGDQKTDMFLTSNRYLYELIIKCEYQYSIFNYRATGKKEQYQVDELLQKTMEMVQQNRDKPCNFSKKGKHCAENILCMCLKSRYKLCRNFLIF